MKLDSANLVPVILSSIVAAIISVCVVFLTRRSETIKLQQSLRTAAYVDFIRGIAGLSVVQKDGLRDEAWFREHREMMMLVAECRCSRERNALAGFFQGGRVPLFGVSARVGYLHHD